MFKKLWMVMVVCVVVSCTSGKDKETQKIEELFPTDNEVEGWVRNPNATLDQATTNKGVDDIIDGAAALMMKRGFVAWARLKYLHGSNPLELQIWQFKNEDKAKEVYDALPTDNSGGLQVSNTWKSASFGDEGRIANTGTTWWFEIIKAEYLFDFMDITPNDDATKTAAETFVTSVIEKVK